MNYNITYIYKWPFVVVKLMMMTMRNQSVKLKVLYKISISIPLIFFDIKL